MEKAKREAEKKASEATGDKKEEESKAPPGNGGSTDRYVWTQSLTEVQVTIPIKDGVTKKDLDIRIEEEGLFVGLKGAEKPILDGKWPEKIDVECGDAD